MRWRRSHAPGLAVVVASLATALMALGGMAAPRAARAEGVVSGYGRHLQFAGYDWRVKTSNVLVGPGPNYFSEDPDSVWVDALGRLHLRLKQDATGRWQAAEVVMQRSLGYGTYRFYLDPLSPLDAGIVLGLFTWNDDPADNHRELDIEVARWREPAAPAGRYSVQPFVAAGHIFSFDLPEGGTPTTHSLNWRPGQVAFLSWTGSDPAPADASSVIAEHVFTDGIPSPGGEQVRINLWLDGGLPPTDGQPAEVTLAGFEFVPAPIAASLEVPAGDA